jgi:putative Mg2+ transporter-C (MgtC) family protein
MMMLDYWDVVLRLGGATLVGVGIGLNRDLHGKPTGVRTLGIVGLGSAVVVLTSVGFTSEAINDYSPVSRVIQGVVTGIGFLGAGVILRDGGAIKVHGLTTAACIWLTACFGMMCGMAAWRGLIVALPLAALVLTLGGPFERAVHRRWPMTPKNDASQPDQM